MLKSCFVRESTLAENRKMCGTMKEMVMKSRIYRAQEMLKRKALMAALYRKVQQPMQLSWSAFETHLQIT
jgi:hypothetical protein